MSPATSRSSAADKFEVGDVAYSVSICELVKIVKVLDDGFRVRVPPQPFNDYHSGVYDAKAYTLCVIRWTFLGLLMWPSRTTTTEYDGMRRVKARLVF